MRGRLHRSHGRREHHAEGNRLRLSAGSLGEKYDWLRRLLVRFGASDGGRFGQYQGSRRIGCAEGWSNQEPLLLVHVGLRGPEHFLAEIGRRFAERHVTVPIGVSFTAQRPQQIVGEEPMSMLVVFQAPSDTVDSDDMEG